MLRSVYFANHQFDQSIGRPLSNHQSYIPLAPSSDTEFDASAYQPLDDYVLLYVQSLRSVNFLRHHGYDYLKKQQSDDPDLDFGNKSFEVHQRVVLPNQ